MLQNLLVCSAPGLSHILPFSTHVLSTGLRPSSLSQICGTQSAPYFSQSFTIAEPTITPSDWAAIFFACLGSEIPNPSASFAIMAILSWKVGAIKEMRSNPCSLNGMANSSFSSNGTSGKISPSIPISAAAFAKRSVP